MILLDVMMPGLDGWRVAEELLDDDRTATIPIIFLTARAELRDRARGIDLGGVDYVTKPFNPVELAPLVRDLLDRVERGERDDLRREKLSELRALMDERDSRLARVWASAIAASTTQRRRAGRRRALSESQAQPTSAPTTGSSIAMIPTRRRAEVPQRADEEEERSDRADHDHPRRAAARPAAGTLAGCRASDVLADALPPGSPPWHERPPRRPPRTGSPRRAARPGRDRRTTRSARRT